jgi:hypothetical protein
MPLIPARRVSGISLLSKSRVVQVEVNRGLPSGEVTSSTQGTARRRSWAKIRIAPAKRKALRPLSRGGQPLAMPSWSSLLGRGAHGRCARHRGGPKPRGHVGSAQ